MGGLFTTVEAKLIRVDILESSPIFLAGERAIFTEAGFKVVGTRTSSREGAAWAADLFVVDPTAIIDQEPIAFLTGIARLSPVLIFIDTDGPWNMVDLTEVGVHGFIKRNSPSHVLIEAARQVANGSSFVNAKVDVYANGMDRHPVFQELSPRENQVLAQIAHGATHSQIARKLGISRHTVDTYVKRIRSKIDAGNKADLTRAAILGGLAQPQNLVLAG